MDRSTNQNKPFIPSKEECLSLLKKYDTPKSVIEHCLVVSQVALEIFENNENYNEDEKE